MLLFLFHRLREHGHGFGMALGPGVVNHPGISAGVLPGFAGDDVAQVDGSSVNCAGDLEIAQAVLGFGAGDCFENLRHFRVSFLAGLLGVGGIGEVGQRFGDDGLPEVPVGGGYVGDWS